MPTTSISYKGLHITSPAATGSGGQQYRQNIIDIADYIETLQSDLAAISLTPGPDGKSAYQVWLDTGHSGTVNDFIASLKGQKGDTGNAGQQGPQGVQGLQGPAGAAGATGAAGAGGSKGDKGDTGSQGPAGPQGQVGPQGATGATGSQGQQGPAGATGATGPAGSSGVVSASAPLNYNATTKALSIDVNSLPYLPSAGGSLTGAIDFGNGVNLYRNAATLKTDLFFQADSISASFLYGNGGQLTGLQKSQLGLQNVPNVDATNASNITTGTLPAARLPTLNFLSLSGGTLTGTLNGTNEVLSGNIKAASGTFGGTSSGQQPLSFGTYLFSAGKGLALYENTDGSDFYGFKVTGGSVNFYAGGVQTAAFKKEGNGASYIDGDFTIYGNFGANVVTANYFDCYNSATISGDLTGVGPANFYNNVHVGENLLFDYNTTHNSSGHGNIVAGDGNQVYGNRNLVMGVSSIVAANNAAVLSGSGVIKQQASGAVTVGKGSAARMANQLAVGADPYTTSHHGGCQASTYVNGIESNSYNFVDCDVCPIADSSTFAMTITVVGIGDDPNVGLTERVTFSVLAENKNGTTTILDQQIVSQVGQASYSVNADDTRDVVTLRIYPPLYQVIRWAIRADTIEVMSSATSEYDNGYYY